MKKEPRPLLSLGESASVVVRNERRKRVIFKEPLFPLFDSERLSWLACRCSETKEEAGRFERHVTYGGSR
jgi:hypothetical protein